MTEGDKVKEAEIRQQIALADPSPLTTQMTWREISALKELLTSQLDALKVSIIVAHDDLVRVPTEVQKQVGYLKELTFEKIDATNKAVLLHVSHLEEKFAIIERQRVEQKSDTRTAVDDALKAAKELVFQQNQANNSANAKSEASFSKQVDQQAALLTSVTNAFNERVNDLKERLAKAEGRGGGMKDFGGWVVAAITIVMALVFGLMKYVDI